jgi:hypothetical protein
VFLIILYESETQSPTLKEGGPSEGVGEHGTGESIATKRAESLRNVFCYVLVLYTYIECSAP